MTARAKRPTTKPVMTDHRMCTIPISASYRSSLGLLHAPAVVDARVVEAALQRRLGRRGRADRAEALRVVAAHADGEVAFRVPALERLVHLDLVRRALARREVDHDLALADDRRRLGHVLGEGDAAPVERHGAKLTLRARRAPRASRAPGGRRCQAPRPPARAARRAPPTAPASPPPPGRRGSPRPAPRPPPRRRAPGLRTRPPWYRRCSRPRGKAPGRRARARAERACRSPGCGASGTGD